jgi:hypothetical protein
MWYYKYANKATRGKRKALFAAEEIIVSGYKN